MARYIRLLILLIVVATTGDAQTFDFSPVDGPWRPISAWYHDGQGLVVGTSSSVVYRSLDGGRTWDATTQPVSFSNLMPYADGYLAPGTEGLYRSEDRGATWSVVAMDGIALWAAAARDSVYVVDAEGVISRSSGDLSSWTPLTLDGWGEGFGDRIAAGAGGALAVLLAQPDQGCTSVLHVSTDAGVTFSTASVDRCVRDVRFHQGSLYLLIAGDASQTPFVEAGLFVWNAGSEVLERLTSAGLIGRFRLQPGDVLTYVADEELLAVGGPAPSIPPVPGRLLDAVISSGSVLIQTRQATSWSDGGRYVHVGVQNSGDVYGLARLAGGDFAVGTPFNGVFRFGRQWVATGIRSDQVFQFEPLWGRADSLLALPNTLSRSNGRPYSILTSTGITDASVVAPELDAACGSNGGRLQVVTFIGDRAVGTCTAGFDESRRFVLDRGGQAVLATEPGPVVFTIWAAPDGTVYASDEPDSLTLDPPLVPVRISTDGGITWSSLSDGLGGNWVIQFAEHDGSIYAAGSTNIYRLDGTTWVPTHSRGALRFAQHDGELYAAAGTAVLHLADGVWTDVATGLDGRTVLGLVVGSDELGTWAAATTYGIPDSGVIGSVMSTRAGLFVGSNEAPPGTSPRTLRAYPNPARGVLTIETPTTGAEIEVVDAIGRRVARVAADRNGVARWDTRDVPTGVYLVRSQGDDTLTTRVVVIR